MIRKMLIALVLLACSAQAGQVIVDHVDGTFTDGWNTYLYAGTPVSFYIRLVNDNTVNAEGICNGFKVWTMGGTDFTPVQGDTLPVTPGWKQMFDLVFKINHLGADGIGADTVGFNGSRMMSTGLPVGFNKLSYTITTGGVEAGETLCLDSTYFPPTGSWLWAPGGSPTWSGRLCYEAVANPCRGVTTSLSCPGALSFDQCQPITYNFYLVYDPWGDEVYSILEGPGTINPYTGTWTYTPTPDDYGTTQLLRVGVTGLCLSDFCESMLTFVSHEPGDIDNDCAVNVADLVYIVDYMFNEGPEPPFMELADIDGSGEVNIADLVYLVNYMFEGGPPPVDPWE